MFSACHFDKQTHERDYYSEFDDPTIEELRERMAKLQGDLAELGKLGGNDEG